MPRTSFSRLYVLLRPASGRGSGHARIECEGRRGRVYLSAAHLLPGQSVRALLLSGDEDTGAVFDLGVFTADAAGQGTLSVGSAAFPADGARSFHTLVLASDWPQGALLLYGALGPGCARPQWLLQEMLRRYLSVPREGAHLPKDAISPPPETRSSVHRLPARRFPPALASLKTFFDTYLPCAPFDAPGWRFVSVPLGEHAPGKQCAIGIQCHGGWVQKVAYAVPGVNAPHPPEGLKGYTWRVGRHGQGYWTLVQSVAGRSEV